MTLDELVSRVNGTWGWSHIELARDGEDLWRAHYQCVRLTDNGWRQLDQPFFKAEKASDALHQLVLYLRGKKVKHGACDAASYMDIPMDLEEGCVLS